jgi:hypothetical protein
VLLAACRDGEEANEIAVGGVWHGALTDGLLRALPLLPPGASCADWHERAAAQVSAVYRNQMPACEGRLRRAVLGGALIERDPRIGATGHALPTRPAQARQPQTVALQGTGRRERAVLRRLRRAIATAAPGGGPSPYLAIQEDAGQPADLRVVAAGGALTVLGADGEALIAPEDLAGRDGPGAVAASARALEGIARFRALQALVNPAPGSRVAGRIRLRLRRFSPGGGRAGMALVAAGDGHTLVLSYEPDSNLSDRNLYVVEMVNDSPVPVYAHLFHLGPDFGIRRLYPDDGRQDAIPPGGVRRAGAPGSGGQPLALYLPDLPFWGSSRDHLKAIATASPADLAGLEQPGLDVPPPAARSRAFPSPLDPLLEAALMGGVRQPTRSPAPDAVDDWGTAELAFDVVRASSAIALEGSQRKVALGGGFSLRLPAGVRGKASLSTRAQAARGGLGPRAALPPPALDEQPQQFQPVAAPGARGIGSQAAVIDLELDEASRRRVTRAHPLRIEMPVAAGEIASEVLPIAFDGEDYLLVGHAAEQPGAVLVTGLPPAATSTRTLGGAIRLFLYKKTGRRTSELGLRSASLTDGQPVYAPVQRGRFKTGDRVAVFVHGFISDTRWMVRDVLPWLRSRALPYEHCLTFDYETFGTSAEDNGALLAQALRDAGFSDGDGITLHVFAHSMGCLVSRCMVELSGGHAFVDGLVMAGPPNRGTVLASVSRGAVYLASALLNRVSSGPILGALTWLSTELYRQSRGWSSIAVDSLVTRRINRLAQPSSTPYLVLAGQNSDPAAKSRLERLTHKLLDAGLDTLFGEQNDAVIGASSMAGVRDGAYPRLTVEPLACDHFDYYADPGGRKAILEWLGVEG